MNDRADTARNIVLLLIAGITAVVVGAGHVAARHFLEPIRVLRDRAKPLAHGRFDDGEDIDVSDDGLGKFVEAFNDTQENLQRWVSELRTVETELGNGNLGQNPRTNLPGELGAIISDLDTGIQKLQNGFVEVQPVVGKFAAVSNETMSSAREIESVSQETAWLVERIAHGTEQQTKQLQTVADEVNDFSATVEEAAAFADGVARFANEAMSFADEGHNYAAEVAVEIPITGTEVGEAVGRTGALDEQVGEINRTVQPINDIAGQTNLLALNVFIEAVCTGETGKGFAVTVNEIKALAKEASEAMDEVESRIGEMRESANDTVDDMQSTQDGVGSGSKTIGEAIEMFDHILGTIQETKHDVEETSQTTEGQAVSTEGVISMVDGISSASEEIASETVTVSVATEEQTVAINEVTWNIQQVSESAQSLKDLVGRFDVGDASDAGESDRDGDAAPGGTSPAAPS